jgi:hypothetical protein
MIAARIRFRAEKLWAAFHKLGGCAACGRHYFSAITPGI